MINCAQAKVMERIIVRRGRFLTYELLRRTFGDDPNVEIMWDRRCPIDAPPPGGRRAPSERRGRRWGRMGSTRLHFHLRHTLFDLATLRPPSP